MQVVINPGHLWIRLRMLVARELCLEDVVADRFQCYRILGHEDRRWPIVVEGRHLESDSFHICALPILESVNNVENCISPKFAVPHEVYKDTIPVISESAVLVPGRRKSVRIEKPNMHVHGILSDVRAEIQLSDYRHPSTFVNLQRADIDQVIRFLDHFIECILIHGISDRHVAPASGTKRCTFVGEKDRWHCPFGSDGSSLSSFVTDIPDVRELRMPEVPVFVLNIPLRIADSYVLLRNTIVIDESPKQRENRLRRSSCHGIVGKICDGVVAAVNHRGTDTVRFDKDLLPA